MESWVFDQLMQNVGFLNIRGFLPILKGNQAEKDLLHFNCWILQVILNNIIQVLIKHIIPSDV